MKKLLALLLALVTTFGVVGCTTGSPVDDDSDAAYTLNVGFYQGGLASQYMDEIIKLYEAKNPDVNVKLKPGKSEYSDGTLLAQIKTSGMDLYVLDSNTYTTFYEAGHLEDITKEVTDKIFDNDGNLVASGATKSIEDTMWKDYVDMYKTSAGKYYAIPNYTSTPGIIYDADLFEEMDYEVPETYPEFIELMEQMVADNITPFTFSTMDYINLSAFESFAAMYEGYNNYNLRGTFDGEHSVLGEINMQNAYLLQQAEGKMAALQFAYDLANNRDFVTQNTRNGLDNTNAQKEFVSSLTQKATASNSRPRVAMFLEHSYWEREAYGTFSQMGSINAAHGYGKRNFKYMKAPKMIGVDGIADTTNTKDTILVGSGGWTAVSAYSTQKDLAKDFLQFMQSRECLAQYLIHASCLRPYDFKLTAEEQAKCTPYGLSLYELLSDENVEFVTANARNDYSRKQNSEFHYDFYFMTKAISTDGIGGVTITGRQAFNLFLQYPNLTVDQYFDGYANYWTAERWSEMLAKA